MNKKLILVCFESPNNSHSFFPIVKIICEIIHYLHLESWNSQVGDEYQSRLCYDYSQNQRILWSYISGKYLQIVNLFPYEMMQLR